MPVIVERLPYSGVRGVVTCPGGFLAVRREQIILSVSLVEAVAPAIGQFPMLLDTGCGFNVVISQEHLERWAGFDRPSLTKIAEIDINEDLRRIPCYDLNLLIHKNVPGTALVAPTPPFFVGLSDGVAVVPTSAGSYPRIPTLGMRGLRCANLRVEIDAQHRMVSMFAP